MGKKPRAVYNLSRNPISCRRNDDDCFTPGKLRQTTAPLVAKIGKLARFSGKNRQIPTPLPANFGRFCPHPRQDSASFPPPMANFGSFPHPARQTLANPIAPTRNYSKLTACLPVYK